MRYNWQQPDWPDFSYNLRETEELLFIFAERLGRISGLLQALPEEAKAGAIIDTMVAEALKTSAIEGEYLSRQDVLSSIRNNLGLNKAPENIRDKKAAGVARLMVAVRETFALDLTQEMLFSWHSMLMEGYRHIQKGQWRSHEDPMQVISGPVGREIVHFEAPPSSRVPTEMKNFILWFRETRPGRPREILHPPVRSALAHVYFETIHPFEDGNGRIGRALSEKALSQGIGRPVLLSLSRTIERNRADYYAAIKEAQRSNDLTSWIKYFVGAILDAQQEVEVQIEFTLAKTRFFDRLAGQLNERQEKVLQKMLEEGPDSFTGGMNAKKYISIAKTSKATATRDLQNLVELGALIPIGGGRSTRYEVRL